MGCRVVTVVGCDTYFAHARWRLRVGGAAGGSDRVAGRMGKTCLPGGCAPARGARLRLHEDPGTLPGLPLRRCGRNLIIRDGEGKDLRWWTWAGHRTNVTLAAILTAIAEPLQRGNDLYVRLGTDLTAQMWKEATANAADSVSLPEVDPRALNGLRFSAALTERLAEAQPSQHASQTTNTRPRSSPNQPSSSTSVSDRRLAGLRIMTGGRPLRNDDDGPPCQHLPRSPQLRPATW